MPERSAAVRQFQDKLRAALFGPQIYAFLPAITLSAYWLGGERALIAFAILLPGAFAAAGLRRRGPDDRFGSGDPETGLELRQNAIELTDRVIRDQPARSVITAGLAVGIDEMEDIRERHGPGAVSKVLRTCAERLKSSVRETDIVARLDGPRFALILTSGTRIDLEALIQLATRLQRRIEEPISLDGTRLFVTASVGFCTLKRAPGSTGRELLEAAENALDDTMASGSGGVRAFTEDMQKRSLARTALSDELPAAMESGQIKPWFQPQVLTESGEVTGFEVLARWDHPDRGIIAPGEFLPAIEAGGLLERLGEVMLYQALNALRTWDTAGPRIPKLSLNFTAEELRNPLAVEKIGWELDRFDLAPDRISIEVLETVIAQNSSDVIIRNLRALSEMGCAIDLDDFGTGHASIANIKRFSVDRIKIDRSFVTQIDMDLEQQNLVAAILTLADRLGLDTLAEGVETPAEQSVLEKLGCRHVQGYGIGRPMPFEDVAPWLATHADRRERRVPDRSAEALAKRPSAGAGHGKTA